MAVFCYKNLVLLSRALRFNLNVVRSMSHFSNIKMGPPDPILGLTEAYKKDQNPKKVNVGVGAYRDDDGKPFILPCVKEADKRIFKRNLNKEYIPIDGMPEFNKAAIELALGPSACAIEEERNVTIQSLSGTGALRIGAAIIDHHFEGCKEAYVPQPTWANHFKVFEHTNIPVKRYRYYNPESIGLDFEGMVEDICNMPKRSILVLHACAHNPTGIDLTCEQWRIVSYIVKRREILPFIDMAYQGFATGDPDADAFSVRVFEEDGHNLFLAQSFAKNMGLYGERIGAFTAICSSKDEADKLRSQAKILVRGLYSSPQINGARIVKEILCDSDLYNMWLCDVKTMADRIIKIRQQLVDALSAAGSKRDWNHITKQIGMFCYSGLTPEQVDTLIKDFSIYMTRDGRISVAGINSKNVEYIANAIHQVTSK